MLSVCGPWWSVVSGEGGFAVAVAARSAASCELLAPAPVALCCCFAVFRPAPRHPGPFAFCLQPWVGGAKAEVPRFRCSTNVDSFGIWHGTVRCSQFPIANLLTC